MKRIAIRLTELLLLLIVVVACSSDNDGEGSGSTSTIKGLVGEWSVYQVTAPYESEYEDVWFGDGDWVMTFNNDGTVVQTSNGETVRGQWQMNGSEVEVTTKGTITHCTFRVVDHAKKMATLTFKDDGVITEMRIVRSQNGHYEHYAPQRIIGSKLVFGENVIQANAFNIAEILQLKGETNPVLQIVSWERTDLDRAKMTITYANSSKNNNRRTYTFLFSSSTEGTYQGNGEEGEVRLEERSEPEEDYAPSYLSYDEISLGQPLYRIVRVLFRDNYTVHTFNLYNAHSISNFTASYEKIGRNTATFSYSCNTSLGRESKTETLYFTSPTGGTYANGRGVFTFKDCEEPQEWAPESLVGKTIEIAGVTVKCTGERSCTVSNSRLSFKYWSCSYSYSRNSDSSAYMELNYTYGYDSWNGVRQENRMNLSFTSASSGNYTGRSNNQFMPNIEGSFKLY